MYLPRVYLHTCPRYRGPWHCLTDTLRQHGVRGVLTGLVPHWWRDGHGFGV